jgi:hypothetical protein
MKIWKFKHLWIDPLFEWYQKGYALVKSLMISLKRRGK